MQVVDSVVNINKNIYSNEKTAKYNLMPLKNASFKNLQKEDEDVINKEKSKTKHPIKVMYIVLGILAAITSITIGVLAAIKSKSETFWGKIKDGCKEFWNMLKSLIPD